MKALVEPLPLPGSELPRSGRKRHVPFTAHLGIRVDSAQDGEARVSMDLAPHLLNNHGAGHGGVLMTLLDIAMANAALSKIDYAREVVTVDMHVGFMAATSGSTGGHRPRFGRRPLDLLLRSPCRGQRRAAGGPGHGHLPLPRSHEINTMHPAFKTLRLPVIAAPLFIISTPRLVIAQCKAGIVGSMPALNARPPELLDEWLAEITKRWPRTTVPIRNRRRRLTPSTRSCTRATTGWNATWRSVPSTRCRSSSPRWARAPRSMMRYTAWGGIVLHDVIDDRFACKAVEKGADGLVAVAAGAGGHAGTTSPFPLVQEIRRWFRGPLALSGAIASGDAILAAQAAGADFGYIGSAFIATEEARAEEAYKEMVVRSSSRDIVYSNLFTGVHGNYLRGSIQAAGLDPDALAQSDASKMNFGT